MFVDYFRRVNHETYTMSVGAVGRCLWTISEELITGHILRQLFADYSRRVIIYSHGTDSKLCLLVLLVVSWGEHSFSFIAPSLWNTLQKDIAIL